VSQKVSRALRNASYQNVKITVDSTLKGSKERVVGSPMHAVKESRPYACIRIFVLRDLPKAVEQRVHNDDICA